MSNQETKNAGTFGPDRLLSIVYIGMFAALVTVGSYISFPLPLSPVPVSLQTLFVVLAGILLGPLKGSLALALYVVLGAVGIPVFAGGTSGMARILGPSGGYLVGFLVGAFVSGLVYVLLARALNILKKEGGRPSYPKQAVAALVASLAGFLVIYLVGIPWLQVVAGMTLPAAITAGLTPFLVGDLLKLVAVALLAPLGSRLFSE